MTSKNGVIYNYSCNTINNVTRAEKILYFLGNAIKDFNKIWYNLTCNEQDKIVYNLENYIDEL